MVKVAIVSESLVGVDVPRPHEVQQRLAEQRIRQATDDSFRYPLLESDMPWHLVAQQRREVVSVLRHGRTA